MFRYLSSILLSLMFASAVIAFPKNPGDMRVFDHPQSLDVYVEQLISDVFKPSARNDYLLQELKQNIMELTTRYLKKELPPKQFSSLVHYEFDKLYNQKRTLFRSIQKEYQRPVEDFLKRIRRDSPGRGPDNGDVKPKRKSVKQRALELLSDMDELYEKDAYNELVEKFSSHPEYYGSSAYLLFNYQEMTGELIQAGFIDSDIEIKISDLKYMFKKSVLSPTSFLRDLALATISESFNKYRGSSNLANKINAGSELREAEYFQLLKNGYYPWELMVASSLWDALESSAGGAESDAAGANALIDEISEVIDTRFEGKRSITILEASSVFDSIYSLVKTSGYGISSHRFYSRYVRIMQDLAEMKLAGEYPTLHGSIQANRDAVIGDLTNLASMAQSYYRKPTAMGGGGNDFTGWSIPATFSSDNGAYTATIDNATQITLVGTGTEYGDDGINPLKVIMKISPQAIISTTIDN